MEDTARQFSALPRPAARVFIDYRNKQTPTPLDERRPRAPMPNLILLNAGFALREVRRIMRGLLRLFCHAARNMTTCHFASPARVELRSRACAIFPLVGREVRFEAIHGWSIFAASPPCAGREALLGQ